MNKYEALQMLGLKGKVSKKDIKKAYQIKAKEFHPDRNLHGAEIMKMINAAYDVAKKLNDVELDNIEVFENENIKNYPDALKKALQEIDSLAGLVIEICGSWVWVSGDTKTHKQALKSEGYKWSKNKSMWYFRPNSKRAYKGKGSREWGIDEIRETFKSEKVNKKQSKHLAAA